MQIGSSIYNALSEWARRCRIMPTINTAQAAAEIAERFVAKYYTWRTLKRVSRSGKSWVVVFDVGVLGDKLVRVTLNSQGKVIGYR